MKNALNILINGFLNSFKLKLKSSISLTSVHQCLYVNEERYLPSNSLVSQLLHAIKLFLHY